MRLHAKILIGAGAVALALFLSSLVIWLAGLAFNEIYNLATEGTCTTLHLSPTQDLDTCGLYKKKGNK